jgi:hypothetical protein
MVEFLESVTRRHPMPFGLMTLVERGHPARAVRADGQTQVSRVVEQQTLPQATLSQPVVTHL